MKCSYTNSDSYCLYTQCTATFHCSWALVLATTSPVWRCETKKSTGKQRSWTGPTPVQSWTSNSENSWNDSNFKFTIISRLSVVSGTTAANSEGYSLRFFAKSMYRGVRSWKWVTYSRIWPSFRWSFLSWSEMSYSLISRGFLIWNEAVVVRNRSPPLDGPETLSTHRKLAGK